MSAPVIQSQQASGGVAQQASQESSTPTSGPPPILSAKPVLSSPGAYIGSFTSSTTAPTAGIHSVNKQHEKPAIAARPVPPPTLPKYSSSFSKVDRDRNEFGGSIDRAEREKVQSSLTLSLSVSTHLYLILTSHRTHCSMFYLHTCVSLMFS